MHLRLEDLEGRQHLVVPTVMLTVGVFHGSRGPVLYEAEELRKSAPRWNGKPVVVYHPDMFGDGSASNPQVFNRQKVGVLFNATFDGKRLKAEAWLDVQRLEAVDPRVLRSLRDHRIMEVSTGLFFNDAGLAGTFNGKPYDETARGIVPDHLAILPDQIGACSIEDGAGLLRNERNVMALEPLTWAG